MFSGVVKQWRSQDFKVGGTPVTWPKGPMRGGVIGEGQRSGPPPHQLGGLGESCHHPHPLPPKNLGFARILWACLSTVGGVPPCAPVATLLLLNEVQNDSCLNQFCIT